jgi:chromosome segregation ATPase
VGVRMDPLDVSGLCRERAAGTVSAKSEIKRGKGVMNRTTEREEYLKETRTRFTELKVDIARLEEQVKRGPEQARGAYLEAKRALATKQEELRTEIREAKNRGTDAWKEVKAGLDGAWGELKEATERARREIREG